MIQKRDVDLSVVSVGAQGQAARRRREADGRVLHRRLGRGESRRAQALERVAGRQGDHRQEEGRDRRGRGSPRLAEVQDHRHQGGVARPGGRAPGGRSPLRRARVCDALHRVGWRAITPVRRSSRRRAGGGAAARDTSNAHDGASRVGEARRLLTGYIGTEHLLLGICARRRRSAARVLAVARRHRRRGRASRSRASSAEGDEVHDRPDRVHAAREDARSSSRPAREPCSLGHNYIGTEHILLGLVRDERGRRSRGSCSTSRLDAETVRSEVIRMLSGPQLCGTADDAYSSGPSAETLSSASSGYAPSCLKPQFDGVDVRTSRSPATRADRSLRGILVGCDAVRPRRR